MQTVIITGGTGLIGKSLSKRLTASGFKVIILTRNIPDNNNSNPNIQYALWDVKAHTIDIAAIQAADFIIHLTGAGVVDKRWTADYKKEIQDSRTKSSALLIDTLRNHSNKVKAVVSASATGWYGADEERQNGRSNFIEADKPATDFLGETCRLWEESITPVTAMGKRLVILRTGIVLGNGGGAFAEFKKPVRFGVAAILSKGKQVVSWIHLDDLCSLYIQALQNEQLSGVYNAVAPAPVSNKTLMLELAKQMKGKFFVPMHVPSIVLKIMLGESSIEVLKSVTVSSKKIEQAGFIFQYPTIEKALEELTRK